MESILPLKTALPWQCDETGLKGASELRCVTSNPIFFDTLYVGWANLMKLRNSLTTKLGKSEFFEWSN